MLKADLWSPTPNTQNVHRHLYTHGQRFLTTTLHMHKCTQNIVNNHLGDFSTRMVNGFDGNLGYMARPRRLAGREKRRGVREEGGLHTWYL